MVKRKHASAGAKTKVPQLRDAHLIANRLKSPWWKGRLLLAVLWTPLTWLFWIPHYTYMYFKLKTMIPMISTSVIHYWLFWTPAVSNYMYYSSPQMFETEIVARVQMYNLFNTGIYGLLTKCDRPRWLDIDQVLHFFFFFFFFCTFIIIQTS